MAVNSFKNLLATIVAFAFQKGGVTKSTQTYSTACRAAESDIKTILIDFDEGDLTVLFPDDDSGRNYIKASHLVSGDLDGRELRQVGENLYLIEADEAILDVDELGIDHVAGMLQQSLQRLRVGFGLIVIDTPPNLQGRMLAAMAASHAVVSPINMGPFTMARLTKFETAFLNVQERYNPKLHHLGWLPCNINSNSRDQLEGLEFLKAKCGEQMFDTVVMARNTASTSLAYKRPVWHQATNGAQRVAAREQLAACDAVLARLAEVETE
ncbi:ParA family protein [Chromobacterium haemolyticum]|uniref:ParA family protein n=1 Tax=Chromobacterium fluminis TaxID=3044269 RepID=A0ABX0L8V4_9NEIS|nr:ParA family protein [Chromobacterium haemolyticum]NHR07448.1 ParA family protein [Chromobacterium haemolyticum]